MRLRWKLDPKPTGLSAVGAPPRGSTLHDGETEYASISCFGGAFSNRKTGCYWVAYGEVPYKNTHNAPCATVEEAKTQAMEYVKIHLKQKGN